MSWPSDELEQLERHAIAVVLTAEGDEEELLRAARLLPLLWRTITPGRWMVLLDAVAIRDQPTVLQALSRAARRPPSADLNRSRIATDIRKRIDDAREHRSAFRVSALLQIASLLRVAGSMYPDVIAWATDQDRNAAHCLVGWLVAHHRERPTMVHLAERLARESERPDDLARRLAWVVAWIAPTPETWRFYAKLWTDSIHEPAGRTAPDYVDQRLAEWQTFAAETVEDGPARMLLEQGGHPALSKAIVEEPDAFVRALLEIWRKRDREGGWHDEACEPMEW